MTAVAELVETPTLDNLAATINREHAQAQEAVADAVRHAIVAGEALLRVREQVPPVDWAQWAAANIALNDWTVKTYMRMARYKELVLKTPEISTLSQARALLVGLPPAVPRMTRDDGLGYSTEVKEQAVDLRSEGLPFEVVAETLGLPVHTVRVWTQPGYQKARRESEDRRRKRRRQEAKALAERERMETIKKALVKEGQAFNEVWTMLLRMDDLLGQARGETEDREKREAIRQMHELRDKMRDMAFSYLGVA